MSSNSSKCRAVEQPQLLRVVGVLGRAAGLAERRLVRDRHRQQRPQAGGIPADHAPHLRAGPIHEHRRRQARQRIGRDTSYGAGSDRTRPANSVRRATRAATSSGSSNTAATRTPASDSSETTGARRRRVRTQVGHSSDTNNRSAEPPSQRSARRTGGPATDGSENSGAWVAVVMPGRGLTRPERRRRPSRPARPSRSAPDRAAPRHRRAGRRRSRAGRRPPRP